MLKRRNSYKRRKALQALRELVAKDPSFRPLLRAFEATSSQPNPIFVRSSTTSNGLKFLCDSSAGGAQGNPLTNIIFPVVINDTLKSTEAEHPGVETRAQQDDINLWGDPDMIFGTGKALRKNNREA